MDHYQGVKGVTSDADVASGAVQVIAPEHFMEHALAEDVHARNAMAQRASNQYGLRLPRDEMGLVDNGLGKCLSIGTAS